MALIALVAVVGVIAYAVVRASRSSSPAAPVALAKGSGSPPRAARPRIPAVAEALGYLGGVLAVTGLGLLVGRSWPDMGTGGRLVLSTLLAVVLAVAGGAVPEQREPALTRLRWFLWLAATAAAGLAAGVLAEGLDAADETIVLAAAVSVAVVSTLLWRRQERPLQQLTALTGASVAVGALVAHVAEAGVIGPSVWLVGAVFIALGLRRQMTLPVLTEAVGAATGLVGAVITTTWWESAGLPLFLASACALLGMVDARGLALERAERVVLGTLGGLAFLQAAPSTIGWFAQDAAGPTGLVTWAVGAVLVVLGARSLVRLPVLTQLVGGVGLLGGAALTWSEWAGFAPLFGLVTAAALVALGTRPGQVLLSALGAAGLLIFVPWSIAWFFPGEGRVPLLIMVSGALIIGVAVVLSRSAGRFSADLPRLRDRWSHGGPIHGSAP